MYSIFFILAFTVVHNIALDEYEILTIPHSSALLGRPVSPCPGVFEYAPDAKKQALSGNDTYGIITIEKSAKSKADVIVVTVQVFGEHEPKLKIAKFEPVTKPEDLAYKKMKKMKFKLSMPALENKALLQVKKITQNGVTICDGVKNLADKLHTRVTFRRKIIFKN